MSKILDVQFTPSNVIKNSTELVINAPQKSPNARIYSKNTISLESYTLTTGVQKTLKCIPFNPANNEYIKLSNNITIKKDTPAISICFWVYVNASLGSNTAIFDFSHKEPDGKYSNRIAAKTNAKEGKIAFTINNSSVLVPIPPQKWTHFCWSLKSDTANRNFEHWKITVNGEKDSAIKIENKVAFDKSLVLNNNLIGKSESEPELSGFDGKLTGITIYDRDIDANLDIYNDDPTIKHLMFPPSDAEGFVGMVGGADTYHNNLYDSGGVDVVGAADSDGLTSGLGAVASGNHQNNLYDFPAFPAATPNHFYPSIDYENMGLGIIFICMTIVIYKYF